MAHDLILAPEAETDVVEAYEWYEARRRGLGEEFLSCVDAALSGISRTRSACHRLLERSSSVGASLSLLRSKTSRFGPLSAPFSKSGTGGLWLDTSPSGNCGGNSQAVANVPDAIIFRLAKR